MSLNNPCYPYGALIECRCDSRGRIYSCVPVMDRGGGASRGPHRAPNDPPDYLDPTVLAPDDGINRPADERTEIILAATFLVLVVLTFIAFMIYRCEKSFSRKKPQRIPSSYSTVSIQTEPSMLTINGLNGGGPPTGNGGLVNGGVHTISNGGTCTLPRYFNGHVPRDLADLDDQDYRMDLESGIYRTRASLASVRRDLDKSRESLSGMGGNDANTAHLYRRNNNNMNGGMNGGMNMNGGINGGMNGGINSDNNGCNNNGTGSSIEDRDDPTAKLMPPPPSRGPPSSTAGGDYSMCGGERGGADTPLHELHHLQT